MVQLREILVTTKSFVKVVFALLKLIVQHYLCIVPLLKSGSPMAGGHPQNVFHHQEELLK